MSRTTTVTVGDRGLWALNDAFGVWLAYMVEEIERDGGPEDHTNEPVTSLRSATCP